MICFLFLRKLACYIACSEKRIRNFIKIFDMQIEETTDEARETAANHNNAGNVTPTVRKIVSRKNL